MKDIKLFKVLFLVFPFFLILSCSDDDEEVTEEIIEEVIFTDYTITAISNVNSIELDWEDVTVSNKQKVTYDIYVDQVLKVADLTVSNYILENLSADTEYNIEVVAKDKNDNNGLAKGTFRTNINPSPSEFVVTSKDITTSEFTLNWTPSIIEGGDSVSYDIYLNNILVVSDLDALSYVFKGLDAETIYNIKITAKSNEFQTTSSESIEITTLVKPVPSLVEITFKDVTSTEFTIEWTQSNIDGGEGVVYDVYLDDVMIASGLDVFTYTFTNLNASNKYSVKVIAKSNEFETISTQSIEIETNSAPSPNDFTLTSSNIQTESASILWSSLTIDGEGGVLADVYINDSEESVGLTSSGYVFTGLTPNTNYIIKVIARSTEYGTTLQKEITFKTEPLPTTFEVTSAIVSPRTTGTFGSAPRVLIRFSDRALLDNIELNGTTYSSYTFAGSDGIMILISDDEYNTLNNKAVKEGIANFSENGVSSSIVFSYTMD